ncbi:MAG: YggS family pyridoxal phosphate-dependent enzyme [Synechococcus sp.]
MGSLAQRYQALLEELPARVKLLAVSKGRSAAEIRALYGLGQRSFGESRVQEAALKQQELADLGDIDWQFIGRLQANKVRPVLKAFSTIHAVDSLSLATRISRIAGELALSPQLYLQLKLRPDANKAGLSWAEAQDLWPQLQSLPAVQWHGVMVIPPRELVEPELGALFAEAVSHADALGLAGRSMGMSGDWRLAAQQGSTVVRVGSALFGSD